MKIRHFCLFCTILAISNLTSMLLFAFISTISKFNDLFVFNLETTFSMNNFRCTDHLIIFFSEIDGEIKLTYLLR